MTAHSASMRSREHNCALLLYLQDCNEYNAVPITGVVLATAERIFYFKSSSYWSPIGRI